MMNKMNKLYDRLQFLTAVIRFLEKQKYDVLSDMREECNSMPNCGDCPVFYDEESECKHKKLWKGWE